MKIKYVSDVHLEFSRFPIVDTKKELDPSKDEILLVAGDTVLSVVLKDKRTDASARTLKWRFDEFLEAVSGFKQVYMIAGNHEAYSYGDVATNKTIIKEYIDSKAITNVHFLENERVPLTDKIDLLACTLWTNMNNRDPNTLLAVNGMMNDFRVSNFGGRKFTTEDAADLFDESMKFLSKELLDTSKTFVVMTHHCPSFESIDPHFKGDVMNYGYASNLDDFIMSRPHISHWVHGHTHYDVDYKIGSTNVLGNMRGYPPDVFSGRATNWKKFKAKSFEI